MKIVYTKAQIGHNWIEDFSVCDRSHVIKIVMKNKKKRLLKNMQEDENVKLQ